MTFVHTLAQRPPHMNDCHQARASKSLPGKLIIYPLLEWDKSNVYCKIMISMIIVWNITYMYDIHIKDYICMIYI